MPFVFRGLVRVPGFAITAIASLALAVGANAAIFTIVNALWLRPLPVFEPERLVVPYYPVVHSTDGELLDSFRLPVAVEATSLSAFESVTYELSGTDRLGDWRPVLRSAPDATPYRAVAVASNYFSVLGIVVQGRGFTPEEDVWGSQTVAVVSQRLWRSLFGSEHFHVGKVLPTTTLAIPIVGVADQRFRGPRLGDDIDVWIPMGGLHAVSDFASEPGIERLTPVTLFARLREGVSLEAAEAEARGVLHARVSLRRLRDVAFPLRSEGGLLRQRSLVQVLWVAAALVLVLGCANLAALFGARSLERRRDQALRLSLGATRSALTRQAATEALVLATAGFLAGLLFRTWLLRGIGALEASVGVPVSALETTLDLRTVAFAALTAVLAAAISCGAALRDAARTDVASLISASAAGGTRRHRLMRQSLLALHAGLAAALLLAAAVLTAAVVGAFRTDAAYAREDVIVARVRPRFVQYSAAEHDTRRAHDYADVITALHTSPEIAEVSNGDAPLRPFRDIEPTVLVVDGRIVRTPLLRLQGGPGYARSVGARLVEGVELSVSDLETSVSPQEMTRYIALSRLPSFKEPRPKGGQAYALIDQTLADLLWPGRSALGRRFTWRSFQIDYTVRGVIAPVGGHPRSSVLTPAMITPQSVGSLDAINPLSLVVRIEPGSRNAVEVVKRTLRDSFPDAPVLEAMTAADALRREMARERMGARIFSYYAIAALLLALAGTYGLVTFMAHHAKRELAVRYALGASERAVTLLLIGRVLAPMFAGIIGGLALSHALAATLAATIVGLGSMPLWLSALAGMAFGAVGLAVAVAGSMSLRRWKPADVLKSA